MKKFCSTCGNQLELNQRFCNKCGAVNPFFVSTFSFLSDQSDELEKLRLEKERIEKELAEKEEKQNEFIRQEQLKKEAEEAERLKLENSEKEKLIKEQLEIGKEQMNLKKEIMKRVKEEAEQFKTETSDFIKEVREELKNIEEENKRLKEEIAGLSKVSQSEEKEVAIKPQVEKNSKEKGLVVSLVVVLIGLTSVLAFLYYNNNRNNEATEIPDVSKQEVMLQPMNPQPIETDTITAEDSVVVTADTIPNPVKTGANNVPVKTEPKVSPTPENVPAKPKEEFVLTEGKIRKDLTGKRISGCDIIIGSASEIESVSNLVLVEKLASGSLKYKFTASIAQGDESYTAAPYIYYSAAGAFIKVDGTNCE